MVLRGGLGGIRLLRLQWGLFCATGARSQSPPGGPGGWGWGETYRLESTVPGWRPTDLVLNRGDTIQVSASGEVLCALPGPSRTDPDGCQLLAPDPCAERKHPDPHTPILAPSAWVASLVARVGDGPGFFVGKEATIIADRPGLLSLGYNDSYHADNQGEFLVKVTRPR